MNTYLSPRSKPCEHCGMELAEFDNEWLHRYSRDGRTCQNRQIAALRSALFTMTRALYAIRDSHAMPHQHRPGSTIKTCDDALDEVKQILGPPYITMSSLRKGPEYNRMMEDLARQLANLPDHSTTTTPARALQMPQDQRSPK